MEKEKRKMFVFLLVAFAIIMAVSGQITLKHAMNEFGRIESTETLLNAETIGKMLHSPFIIIGLVLYAFSAFAWLAVLSLLDVSMAFPLTSMTYVLVAVLAFFIFKENITLVRWAGIFLVIMGCFLVSRSI